MAFYRCHNRGANGAYWVPLRRPGRGQMTMRLLSRRWE